MKYKIITMDSGDKRRWIEAINDTLESFSNAVSEHIKQGWKPLGGVSIYGRPDMVSIRVSQAMIREEPE